MLLKARQAGATQGCARSPPEVVEVGASQGQSSPARTPPETFPPNPEQCLQEAGRRWTTQEVAGSPRLRSRYWLGRWESGLRSQPRPLGWREEGERGAPRIPVVFWLSSWRV